MVKSEQMEKNTVRSRRHRDFGRPKHSCLSKRQTWKQALSRTDETASTRMQKRRIYEVVIWNYEPFADDEVEFDHSIRPLPFAQTAQAS
jgi:hypothetical protein